MIDPERDVDRYIELAAAEGLEIVAAAETHIHADFLSGARELAEHHGVKLYVLEEGGPDWQSFWAKDSDYDVRFLKDGDTFDVGNIRIQAVHTPGHTPEHVSYLVTDLGGGADEPMRMATGDFVFVGDLGRPDLLESAAGIVGMMEPSARTLYASTVEFLDLPDYLRVWPAHGAGSACGKALGAVPETTVGYERRFSPAIAAVQQGEDAFVEFILEGQPEPPPYFARMKALNRDGPPLLGGVPSPEALRAEQLVDLAGQGDVVVLDTRTDRAAYFAGHVARSIYAPLNKSFHTVCGLLLRSRAARVPHRRRGDGGRRGSEPDPDRDRHHPGLPRSGPAARLRRGGWRDGGACLRTRGAAMGERATDYAGDDSVEGGRKRLLGNVASNGRWPADAPSLPPSPPARLRLDPGCSAEGRLELGLSSIRPVHDVVGVREAEPTAREAASAISGIERTAKRQWDGARLATHVEQ